MWDEFFVSFLYSVWIKNSLSEKILGLKVKSSLSEIAKKYGIFMDVPKFFELPNYGGKKPDFLFTVGSGWKNLGKYSTGIL